MSAKEINILSQADLNIEYSPIYIETTKGECYEITKHGKNYMLNDLVNSKIQKIESFFSIKPAKSYKEILSYDGVVYDHYLGVLVNSANNEGLKSKGKIRKCLIKSNQGKHTFYMHMLDKFKGKKISFDTLYKNNFTVVTNRRRYEFKVDGNNLYCENRKIVTLISVLNENENVEVMPEVRLILSGINFYIDKPFLMLSNDTGEMEYQYVGEKVIDIESSVDISKEFIVSQGKEDISTTIPEYLPEPKPVEVAPKIGRNEPCPCGSGKKFKKCCIKSVA